MKIKLIILGCLVAISTSLWATDAGEFRGETKAKIEILQKQNDELTTKIDEIEKNNVNIETFKTSIVDQDKRIQDLSFYTSLIATIIAILTLIVGAVGVAFPYLMFRQNSKSQEEAKKDIETWKEKTKFEFDKELEMLKDHAENTKTKMNISLQEIKEAESKMKNIQNGLQNEQPIIETDQQENDSLSKVIKNVLEKPQIDYTFNDWNMLAFDAYNRDKKEDALYYWRKAIEVNEIILQRKAETLFNISIVLNQLGRKEEIILQYNDMIKEFNETQDDVIQTIIAKVFFNKGVTLGGLNKYEEAISVYDELINQFQNIKNEKINELIVKALFNKGIMLGKLYGKEDEIAIYELIFQKFKGSKNEEILQIVGTALLNNGIILGEKEEYEKSIRTFNLILEEFNTIKNEKLLTIIAQALINKGLILGRLNKGNEAISIYEFVIQKFQETQNENIKNQIINAYINRTEMKLILGQDVSEIEDNSALLFLNDYQEDKLKYLMIKTIRNALIFDQTKQYEELKKQFYDTELRGWEWKELDDWASRIEDINIKGRVLSTIEQFKNWHTDPQSSRE